MPTVPVKQDIFRFVTFRTPNKILSQDFQILLAQHPIPEASYWEPVFAEAVVDAELLNQLIENFTAISLNTPKDINWKDRQNDLD